MEGAAGNIESSIKDNGSDLTEVIKSSGIRTSLQSGIKTGGSMEKDIMDIITIKLNIILKKILSR